MGFFFFILLVNLLIIDYFIKEVCVKKIFIKVNICIKIDVYDGVLFKKKLYEVFVLKRFL